MGLAALVAASRATELAQHPLTTDGTGTQGACGNQQESSPGFADSWEAGIKAIVRVVPMTYTRGLTDALDA